MMVPRCSISAFSLQLFGLFLAFSVLNYASKTSAVRLAAEDVLGSCSGKMFWDTEIRETTHASQDLGGQSYTPCRVAVLATSASGRQLLQSSEGIRMPIEAPLGAAPPADSPAAAPASSDSAAPMETSDPPEATLRAAASPGAAPASATASVPAPEPPQVTVPLENITVVWTAEGLQAAAVSGAVDIEIRAHLDLRGLRINPNPEILGVEDEINLKRLALLYATPPLRSIRGNCSNPEPEVVDPDTGIARRTVTDILPLKPRQCVLVVEDTLLMVNGGRVWVDNLYLKLSRRHVRPSFTFITAGARNGEINWPGIERSTVYVTNTTFQAEERGSARALVGDFTGISFYVDGCIFTDWAGFASVVLLKFQSVAHIRNTVFRNMRLHVELVDISHEGMVHFSNVSLANVTLERGAVVSTTNNDYQSAIGFYLTYYAEDDAAYDVEVEAVPPGQRGIFGEEFRIANDTLSDCLYLLEPPGSVPPGCPAESTAARNRTIDRGSQAPGDRQSTGVPFAPGPFEDYSDLRYTFEAAAPAPGPAGDYRYSYNVYTGDEIIVGSGVPIEYTSQKPAEYFAYEADYDAYAYKSKYSIHLAEGPGQLSDYEVINDAQLRYEFLMVKADDAWLLAAQQALPERPASPGWPPFRPPAVSPHNRTSLRPDPVSPPPTTAAAMLGPLQITAQPQASAGGVSPPGREVGFVAVAFLGVLLVPLLLWLRLRKRTKATRSATRELCQQTSCRSMSVDAASCKVKKVPHGATKNLLDSDLKGRGALAGPGSPAGTADSVVSRGADIPPASALNPAYEYKLPPHLSMCAHPPSSLVSDFEPGHTDVVAPYTVASRHMMHASSGSRDAQRRSAVLPADDSVRTAAIGCQMHGENVVVSSSEISAAHAAPASMRNDHDLHQVKSNSPLEPVESSSLEEGRQCAIQLRAPHIDITQKATDTSAGGRAVRRLQRQLDSFTSADRFLGRFEMLGRHHRRLGGQAVVQFAAGANRTEFAVKFFLDRAAFLTEAALYAAAFPSVRSTASTDILKRVDETAATSHGHADAVSPMSDAVARFLPQVEAVCDGAAGGLEDPRGRPLPPCIVMEKGESLQDLCDRAEPDVFTVFSVLSNVSQRLVDMHAAGYVHRDIKPANVMWLPRQNRWTVIDFGCVARVGEAAPLSFSLAYAAPEVASAWLGQEGSIEARPALDAWSLGVTAFELLTGAPAFDLLAHGRSKVMAMLAGDVPLPWEGELSREVRAKLGVLGRPVLQLLQRKEAHRITLEAFHTSCTQIFAASTSAAPSAGLGGGL